MYRKESNPTKTATTLLLAVCAIVLSAGRVAAQSQPGRLLSTTQNQTIIACNTDSSNCFTIVGVGGMPDSPALAGSPSVANNGTIAFNAIFSANGTCSPATQGICPPLIFLMNADGTNVRQVTSNPNPATNFNGDRNAIISPDGTRIAFVASRNAAADGTNPAEVYVMNADGTGIQQVTPFYYQSSGSQIGQFYSVAWSPDSSKLAVMGNAYGTFCGTSDGQPIAFDAVAEVNPDGSNFNYLTCIKRGEGSGHALDWSRDGTLIAYNGFDSSNSVDVAFLDLTGMSRFAPLTSSQLGSVCAGTHCLHFSPDTTKLAYANASGNISIVNLNGAGRSDTTVPFRSDVFWEPGPAIPAAAHLTVAPNPVEVWPGFTQQLTPTLSDAGSNLILHTAASYGTSGDYGTDGACLNIGPYGLAFYNTGRNYGSGSISATNAGLSINMISYKCWTTPPCTYSLNPMSGSFPSSGGSGSAAVMSNPGSSGSTCPYSASSNASWIAITSGASGSGSGSVGFSVAANTGSTSRQGSLTIAGLTFTVTQDGPNTVTLQSISVTPNPASVPAGLTQQFTATGHYSNGSTQDLTTSVTWSSSNTSIATIGNSSGSQGLATGIAAGGPVTITAALNGISGTAQLTVTAPVLQSITVAPSSASVAAGLTQQFTATGRYSDGTTQNLTTAATWSSSNTSLATISNSLGTQGLVMGVSAGGPVTITAALNGISGTAQLTVRPGFRFVTVPPCRVMDTRNVNGPLGGPYIAAGTTRTIPIQSSDCVVPANAVAYSLNTTVVPRSGTLGYLTVWPTGQSQPLVSTLNSLDGSVLANAAIVPAGTSGSINAYATNDTELIVDINGYFVPPGTGTFQFYPLTPCRILDTRNANGTFGGPTLAGATSRSFPVPSSACGVPGTAAAYSLNVTVVPQGTLGYLTIWPTGQLQPLVSTLNSIDGTVLANAAIVPAGTNGAVSFYASNTTDVVVDINGYFAPPGTGGLNFYTVTPCRIVDTRYATGTFGGPILNGGATRTFPLSQGSCGLPSNTAAYSLNMTVAPSGFLGYLTTWPTGGSQPLVSTLNAFKSQVVANAALVPAGTTSSINVYVTNSTQVIIDTNGYFGQ